MNVVDKFGLTKMAPPFLSPLGPARSRPGQAVVVLVCL